MDSKHFSKIFKHFLFLIFPFIIEAASEIAALPQKKTITSKPSLADTKEPGVEGLTKSLHAICLEQKPATGTDLEGSTVEGVEGLTEDMRALNLKGKLEAEAGAGSAMVVAGGSGAAAVLMGGAGRFSSAARAIEVGESFMPGLYRYVDGTYVPYVGSLQVVRPEERVSLVDDKLVSVLKDLFKGAYKQKDAKGKVNIKNHMVVRKWGLGKGYSSDWVRNSEGKRIEWAAGGANVPTFTDVEFREALRQHSESGFLEDIMRTVPSALILEADDPFGFWGLDILTSFDSCDDCFTKLVKFAKARGRTSFYDMALDEFRRRGRSTEVAPLVIIHSQVPYLDSTYFIEERVNPTPYSIFENESKKDWSKGVFTLRHKELCREDGKNLLQPSLTLSNFDKHPVLAKIYSITGTEVPQRHGIRTAWKIDLPNPWK